MKVGFGTGTAPEPGQPPKAAAFVPPSVADLAQLFPQLELLELLGQGGMGAVYKARQPALDRLVALKILPPQLASGPGFTERFTREARALARLTHSNIVTVHDFGKAGDFHYFIMEFVDGANLRQIEKAGKLATREALRIVPQICEALQFAHDEGIVHRDIKPENIMIDKRGRVKIADFGIAKILGKAGDPTLTGAKDVVGTPHYMAPEQIERPQTVDHRADIYSLGVVFYEILTGELPLGKFAPPSKKVQVDVRLDEVVLHTLEKEPDRRYQHASLLKTDVETIAGETLKAGGQRDLSATIARQHSLAGAARPLHIYLALGLFLAGTLGTLLLMTLSRRDEPVLVFGLVALALALVFGILSWRDRLGKAVTVVTIVIFVAMANIFPARRAAEAARRAEALRAEAMLAQDQRTQENRTNDAAVIAQEGWQLWQSGRMAEAITRFEQATRLDVENANAWNGLGWASFNSRKTAEAEKAFQKVLALDPNHPAALTGSDKSICRKRNSPRPNPTCSKPAPKLPAAWYGLARLYLLQGRFAEAEKWAQNLVDSGQADEVGRRMLDAAKSKQLSEGSGL